MNRIRELREAKGLTQAELGRLVGVQQPAINKYESGMMLPPLGKAFRLAEALECSIQDLKLVDGTGA